VRLDSYGVSIPSIVALKVAKDIHVNVDLRASAEKPREVPAPVAQAPAEAPPPVAAAAEPSLEKPRAAAGTAPRAPRAPREPARAAEPGRTAPPAKPAVTVTEPAAAAVITAPATSQEAAASLRALLRKAHYELVHGDETRVLRLVQQAQKLLPRIEEGLTNSP
jgi:hypothetical protein